MTASSLMTYVEAVHSPLTVCLSSAAFGGTAVLTPTGSKDRRLVGEGRFVSAKVFGEYDQQC